jgi:hypothetical protein
MSSRNFFAKSWPRIELDGLVAMSDSYDRVLPIWLDIDRAYVAAHSPTLAGRRAAVAQVAGDAARVAEAIQRSIEHQVQRTSDALIPMGVLCEVPEILVLAELTFGEGAARRRIAPTCVVRRRGLVRLLGRLDAGVGLIDALEPNMLKRALLDSKCHLPRDFGARFTASEEIDLAVLSVYTDVHYLQDVSPVRAKEAVLLHGRLGRGGVAEFVTPSGELRGSNRYGHTGVTDPHLIGTVGLMFATAFRRNDLIGRSPVFVCARRGIRLPADVWTDPAGQPLWNVTNLPATARRYAFESVGHRFPSTDLFTVDYGGTGLRQVTQSDEPAHNSLSHEELGWVFRWESATTFTYSRMHDGRPQSATACDEPVASRGGGGG